MIRWLKNWLGIAEAREPTDEGETMRLHTGATGDETTARLKDLMEQMRQELAKAVAPEMFGPLTGTYEHRLKLVADAVRADHAAFGAKDEWEVYTLATSEASVIIQAPDGRCFQVPYVIEADKVRLVMDGKQEVKLTSSVVSVQQAALEKLLQVIQKPYTSTAQLPAAVRRLPKHGQEIYLAAFNAAYKEYDDEGKAHATAWAAVKNKYERRADGKWVAKARGEGQGAGGPRQGDGGTDTCVCPECGHEQEHERGTPCTKTACADCGELMVGKAVKTEGDVTWDHVGDVLKAAGEPSPMPKDWFVPILKVDSDRRLVWGIVLEPGDPDHVDSQGDYIQPDQIEAAAHDFMKRYRHDRATMGEQHAREASVDVVESYLAPQDFQINEQAVKAGSWVLVSYVSDEGMWASVKAGGLTGYSIGGLGERVAAA